MIKHLITHGNSKALVIDKTLLQIAGLTESAAFKITINPSGITIQSVGEEATLEEFKSYADDVLKKGHKHWKRLADK